MDISKILVEEVETIHEEILEYYKQSLTIGNRKELKRLKTELEDTIGMLERNKHDFDLLCEVEE